MIPKLGEFERIARFFAPLAHPAAAGLTDDVAFLDPPPGKRLVLKTDALVEGVHYLVDDPPDLVAKKLLRVNLSDLAAKGAVPLGYLLTTALPDHCDESWLEAFARGLGEDQREFGIGLLGGDSTRTPGPACLSVAAIGVVDAGREIRRSGARPGDAVWVSGTLGDAALGLKAIRGELGTLTPEHRAYLADRYRLPQPRMALGPRLIGIASAMLDVSDGLVADLGHICETSGVAAVIEAARVPLSPAARAVGTAALPLALGGGDDYELLFTAPGEVDAALGVTRIGRIEAGAGVRVVDAAGEEIDVPTAGWQHF